MKDEKRQLSLVAFYGEKDLTDLVWKEIFYIQETLEKYLPDNFQSYLPQQIHSTIIGLEAGRIDSAYINKNFYINQKSRTTINLSEAFKKINDTDLLPVEIRIGGFNNHEHIFTSRGVNPFSRSFIIQDNTVAVMGWPHYQGIYAPVLDTFRRRLNNFGVLHKYHTAPDSFDNDFYMVIGSLKEQLQRIELERIQQLIRDKMSSWNSNSLQLTSNDLKVVAYKDTKLHDVVPYSIEDASSNINSLYNYYPDYDDVVKSNEWLI